MTRAMTLLAVVVATLLMPGCAAPFRTHSAVDAVLDKKLESLDRGRTSVPLRDLTGGDWEWLYIPEEAASADEVATKVGAPVPMRTAFDGVDRMLVFMKGKDCLRISFVSNRLGGSGYFGPDVRVTGIGKTLALQDSAPSLVDDWQLENALSAFSAAGGTTPLRDVTGGDWDRIFVARQGTTRVELTAIVGSPLEMEHTYRFPGNVLVFLKGPRVQRAVRLTPPGTLDRATQGMFGPDVRLTSAGGDAAPILVPQN
ncbi:MAG: hypothetical protein HOQ24_06660 [Mycobacteriaceae bacterium]|nr:hypothetical protein [Mycobacteriaceae bacterium]